MAERMNFVTKRGRTASCQRNQWLRNLRAERRPNVQRWMLRGDSFEGIINGSLNFAKRQAIKKAIEHGCSSHLLDMSTLIEVYERKI